jgi:phage terminase large subunit-like protein
VITLEDWRATEARIDAYQVADGSPLLDRLEPDFLASLEPLESLALAHSPEAYLRPRQLLDGYVVEWLVAVFLAGRGFGKSFAAAGWLIQQILAAHHSRPQDFALVAPTLDECWSLQWEKAIKPQLPPWVRVTERVARNEILFPDHGVSLLLHSAEISEYRGPNLRGAWLEEPVKYPRGETLWRNLRLALRVPGAAPPRAVVTTTPPRELNWILDLCAAPDTIVVRGRMRDNPMIDPRSVAAAYRDYSGSLEGARELDGEVVLGVDRALFRLAEIEAHRVSRPPALESIVVAVDPAQSSKKDADPVGLVVVGISRGHLYVLASCSEQLEPLDWARRAIDWARLHDAGSYVVEPTGSGSYPRATLEAQMRILGAPRRPVLDSPARGSKADRAAPLSAACASGRLHLVGRHPALERELTTWFPGAGFSPGALDALVHGAAHLTSDWTEVL